MSCFVFGALRPTASTAEAAWAATRAAVDEGVGLLMGCNVHQPPVLQVLQERNLTASGALVFLVTDSPISDNTEELVSPFRELGDIREIVGPGVARIGRWLERIRPVARGEIHVFLMEGYDDGVEEIGLSAPAFAETITARIAERGDLPSLWVRIEPS